MPHSPALDGLRGVAVVSVIAYHFCESAVPGGFLGVDLFFVLSGYLITSLLVIEHEASGAIRLAAFWARRARRLLPAALALVGVVMIGVALLAPARFVGLRDDALASVSYVANWHFIATQRSYFAEFSRTSPLQHLWSLSIEEQFYVLWPLALVTLLRRPRLRASALPLVTLAIVASAVECAWLYFSRGPSRAYFGTDARVHELLVGVALALVMRETAQVRPRVWSLRLAPVAATGGIATIVLLPDESPAYYYGVSLLFSIGCAIVIAAIQTDPSGRLARGLAFGPLAGVGVVSYGVYLWHWPVHVTVDALGLTATRAGILSLKILATALVAVVSYVTLERPARRFRGSNLTTAAAACIASAAVAASIALAPAAPHVDAARKARRTQEMMGFDPLAPRIPAPDSEARLRIALAGDSVAGSMHLGMAEFARGRRWQIADVHFIRCGVTGVFDPRTVAVEHCGSELVAEQRRLIATFDPQIIVVQSRYELYDFVESTGEVREASSPAHSARIRALYQEALQRLTARGATVVFVDPIRVADSFCPKDQPSLKCRVYAAWQSRIPAYMSMLDDVGLAFPGKYVRISLTDVLCPGEACPDTVDRRVPRPDGNHFSIAGGAWIAAALVTRAEAKGVHFGTE